MKQYQEDDLVRVKELLQRTGEFIAYFELAETKMMEWRQEIEQQASRLELHTQTVNTELASVHNLLLQTGAANTENAHNHQEKLKDLTNSSLEKIEKHTTQTLQMITTQLSKYDVQHFHRIATESCDHVERVANDAIVKSNKLLQLFQFRFNCFTVITTVITAFIIVLYLSDEFPWEMHHQAMNERQAGKVLLQAWPNLTQLEKAKILSHEAPHNG